jgi:Protein of unknown function (DUF1236)
LTASLQWPSRFLRGEIRFGAEPSRKFYVIARYAEHLLDLTSNNLEISMNGCTLYAAVFAVTALVTPLAAHAQGVPEGADHGARVGEHAAGPVGAVVGGVIGGVVGGVNGILGVDDRPRFHTYVVERHIPSYEYRDDLRVGAELPGAGVTYYEAPPEYRLRDYRYTVVNGHTVLVDPSTHRIVDIVD